MAQELNQLQGQKRRRINQDLWQNINNVSVPCDQVALWVKSFNRFQHNVIPTQFIWSKINTCVSSAASKIKLKPGFDGDADRVSRE